MGLCLVIVVMIVVGVLAQEGGGITAISAQDARKLIEKDSTVVLLDVRTPAEWTSETGHLQHSLLIPVQELESRVDELAPYKGRTIIAYCRTGRRSAHAASLLTKRGFKVMNLEGGIVKWSSENLPVIKEKAE